MRDDIADLRPFRAIAGTGNLTAAAEGIFRSPGSAGYGLGDLERTVGVPLFVRTPRGMEIAAAGEWLPGHAVGIPCALEAMQGGDERLRQGDARTQTGGPP